MNETSSRICTLIPSLKHLFASFHLTPVISTSLWCLFAALQVHWDKKQSALFSQQFLRGKYARSRSYSETNKTESYPTFICIYSTLISPQRKKSLNSIYLSLPHHDYSGTTTCHLAIWSLWAITNL